jgi:hypothetical protein
LDTLKRAISLEFNTIVIGPPGGGVTSLLAQLAAAFEDKGRSVKRVWAGQARSSSALLDAVSDALDDAEEPVESSGPAAALRRFNRLTEAHPAALIVIDEVPGAAGHDVFGRMRDELWGLKAQWLVGTREDDAAVLLQPPADAFFETIYRLRPLPNQQIVELLARRDPDHEIDDHLRGRIVERSNGNPSMALALAREALVRPPDSRESFLESNPVEDVRDRFGEPAARLFSELLQGGPSGPSDDLLLRRLNWSRPRAYQVFQTLEHNGLVRSSDDHSGRPGRPRKIYEVAS